MTVTTSEPGKRRRRALWPLDVFHSEKPLTPKHLEKLVPLRNTAALQGISDYWMGHEGRDTFEMASWLAQRLKPKAENPLLAEQSYVSKIPFEAEDASVRITWTDGHSGHRLTAFRVLRAESTVLEDASFGVAFLSTPDVDWALRLCTALPDGENWRENDLRLLEAAIALHHETMPKSTKTLVARLRAAFSERSAA